MLRPRGDLVEVEPRGQHRPTTPGVHLQPARLRERAVGQAHTVAAETASIIEAAAAPEAQRLAQGRGGHPGAPLALRRRPAHAPAAGAGPPPRRSRCEHVWLPPGARCPPARRWRRLCPCSRSRAWRVLQTGSKRSSAMIEARSSSRSALVCWDESRLNGRAGSVAVVDASRDMRRSPGVVVRQCVIQSRTPRCPRQGGGTRVRALGRWLRRRPGADPRAGAACPGNRDHDADTAP